MGLEQTSLYGEYSLKNTLNAMRTSRILNSLDYPRKPHNGCSQYEYDSQPGDLCCSIHNSRGDTTGSFAIPNLSESEECERKSEVESHLLEVKGENHCNHSKLNLIFHHEVGTPESKPVHRRVRLKVGMIDVH